MPDDIQPNDPVGSNWVHLGQWLEAFQAATGNPLPSGDSLLTTIYADDTEGAKFAKWQRWLKAIQQSI